MRIIKSPLPRIAFILIATLVLRAPVVQAQSAGAPSGDVLTALNRPAQQVRDSAKSYASVLGAFLQAPQPPREIGDSFNVNTIWDGMDNFSSVAEWAKACEPLGKALIESQRVLMFGLPYGKNNVSQEFRGRGLYADVGEGATLGTLDLAYLNSVRTVAAYAVADMYRLGEEGKFDEALTIAVANIRFLRLIADRQMSEEQSVAMELMIDCLRASRDFVFTYLDKIPAATLQRFALKEFSMLQPMDHEQLRRLQLPEGDRIVAEAVLGRVFSPDGSPDAEVFATHFSRRQSESTPLALFGANKMWQSIATAHGSLDATRKRLTFIYDDWWRRWRMNPYGPIFGLATELSRTNEVRYAAVVFSLRDLQRLFSLRDVLISEINGTAVIAGICAHYREYGNKWPKEKAEAYSVYVVKRMDFDPYHKSYPANRNDGRLPYQRLGSAVEIETPFGRVHGSGVMLWARAADHEDGGGTSASLDGLTGDLVFWPPLRARARQEGLID
ncbi:MAG: hypothetical protein EXS00_02440 [Phycisphaerales bacterium]|nr:hypothetical protein [Phycisphaerales bacterium]